MPGFCLQIVTGEEENKMNTAVVVNKNGLLKKYVVLWEEPPLQGKPLSSVDTGGQKDRERPCKRNDS